MALTFTNADLENLKAALISGALSVKIGDREVTYRSQKEIIAAIKMIQEAIDGTTSSDLQNVKASFSKGK